MNETQGGDARDRSALFGTCPKAPIFRTPGALHRRAHGLAALLRSRPGLATLRPRSLLTMRMSMRMPVGMPMGTLLTLVRLHRPRRGARRRARWSGGFERPAQRQAHADELLDVGEIGF